MQEIGIFCGTFNPIHIGHMLMAETARDQFALEKVLFITSPRPPHRAQGLLDQEERAEMVAAAVGDNAFFEASRLELDRPGLSYTIETVKEVSRLYGPAARLNLIIGEDNLPYIKQWRQSSELVKLCRLLVAPRHFPSPNPKYDFSPPLHTDLSDIEREILDFPLIPISASAIRARLAAGRSVRYMVPDQSWEIITRKGYYRSAQS